MSKRSFMAIDPLVEDPEFEHDTVIAEQLEQALLSSVQQQASEGVIPAGDLARIMELVKNDQMELAEAVEKVQREAQERQAEVMPAGSPETMPGLAAPGMGAEAMAAMPPEPATPQSLEELVAAL